MIVLDENILASQRLELLRQRIVARQIGYDLGRKGMQDDGIIVSLRRLSRPTFFTRDGDFFDKTLARDKLCLAFLDCSPLEAAFFIRRAMRHPGFRTWSQRRGTIARISANGISIWRLHASRMVRLEWPR